MAAYWVDPQNGDDGNSGASIEQAKATIQPLISAANTINVVDSATVTEEVLIGADNVTITSPGLFTWDAQSLNDYCVDAVDRDGIILENFTAKKALRNCVRIRFQNSNITSMIANNVTCEAAGPGLQYSDVYKGTGFLIQQVALGVSMTGLSLNGCVFTQNARSGFDARGDIAGTLIYCEASYNGQDSPAHGFTTHPIGTQKDLVSDGVWNVVSGDIYRRAAPAGTVASLMQTQVGASGNAYTPEKTTGTTPGAYQFSESGGYWYVNLDGLDPDSIIMWMRTHDMGPLEFLSCKAHHNIDYDGVEGHGFSGDDASSSHSYKWCIAYANQGQGFQSNRSDHMTYRQCVSAYNRKSGFQAGGYTSYWDVQQCASYQNNNPSAGGPGGDDIADQSAYRIICSGNTIREVTLKNLIGLETSTGYGLYACPTANMTGTNVFENINLYGNEGGGALQAGQITNEYSDPVVFAGGDPLEIESWRMITQVASVFAPFGNLACGESHAGGGNGIN